jgi:hypothetical protein
MTRASLVLPPLLVCLAGCAGSPLVRQAAKEPNPRPPSESALGSRPLQHEPCESALPGTACRLEAKHQAPTGADVLQIWGKDNAPAGLRPAEIEAFLQQRARELRSDCWDRRFDGWERAAVEYGLAVDPSGAVFPLQSESALAKPAAGLERHGARASSPELAECVERHLDSWTFPRATMPTWMLLRFGFDKEPQARAQ